jgi:hypothetical protein
MRKQSLQQAYKLFLENTITRSQLQKIFYSDSFARKFVSPANSLEDSIKILKTKRILSEEFTPGFGDQTNETFKESVVNQPQYSVYLISLTSNKIVGGYSNPDEARTAAPQLGQTLGKLKLTTGNNLKTKYGIDPLDDSNWADLPRTDPAPTQEQESDLPENISELIDNMLGEYRNTIEQALREADLPDSYDDDLKAAGLAEDEGGV